MKDNRIAWPLALFIGLLVAIPFSAMAWMFYKRHKETQIQEQIKPVPDPLPAPPIDEEPSAVEVVEEKPNYFHPATENIILDQIQNTDNSYDNLDNHD